VSAGGLVRALQRKAETLPSLERDARYVIAAREEVIDARGALAITAADIFDG